MQTAIDRVIRTFAFKPSIALRMSASDERLRAEQDEAAAFATQLLGNYREQLSRRAVARD